MDKVWKGNSLCKRDGCSIREFDQNTSQALQNEERPKAQDTRFELQMFTLCNMCFAGCFCVYRVPVIVHAALACSCIWFVSLQVGLRMCTVPKNTSSGAFGRPFKNRYQKCTRWQWRCRISEVSFSLEMFIHLCRSVTSPPPLLNLLKHPRVQTLFYI